MALPNWEKRYNEIKEIENNKVSKNGDTMTGDLILNNGHYLQGIDNVGNQMNLIRAFNNEVSPGQGDKGMTLYAKSPIKAWINGTTYTLATKEQNILWRDTDGSFMSGSQTANLSQKISEQNNGIVLFFQPYNTNTNKPQSYGFYAKFIPKKVIEMFGNGYGYSIIIPDNSVGIIAGKYLYLHDDKIVGNDANIGTSNMFGSTINNKNAVLTAVIGV